jgi:hypothetical protein
MKPKPFWVLKNFTVPTGITVPFTLLVERPLMCADGNFASFGSSLEQQPKAGSVSARSAENQVAGGDLNGFRRNVNGLAG